MSTVVAKGVLTIAVVAGLCAGGYHMAGPTNNGYAAPNPYAKQVVAQSDAPPAAQAQIPSGKPTDLDEIKQILNDKFGVLESHLAATDKKADNQQEQINQLQANMTKLSDAFTQLVKSGKLPQQDVVVASNAASQARLIADTATNAAPSTTEERVSRLEKIVGGMSPECLCHQQAQRVVQKIVYRYRTRVVREPVYAGAPSPSYYGGEAENLNRQQLVSYQPQQQTYQRQPGLTTLVQAAAPTPTGVITSGPSGAFVGGGGFIPNISFSGGTRVSVAAPAAAAPAQVTTIVKNQQGGSTATVGNVEGGSSYSGVSGSGNSRITGSGNASANGYGGTSTAYGGQGGAGGQGGQGGRGGVGGGCTGTCAASTSAAAAVTGGAVATPNSVGTFNQGSTSGASSPSAPSGGGGSGHHHK